MKNFTWEIKRELLASLPEKKHLNVAFSAFLTTGGITAEQLAAGRAEIVGENERIFEYFAGIAERLGGRLTFRDAHRTVATRQDRLVFLAEGFRENALVPPPVPDGEEERAAAIAYLRAAFLGGGSCTVPRSGAKTGYHLEFRLSDGATTEAFCALLERLELFGNVVLRGGRQVVYLRSCEAICDFLYVIGASSALRYLEGVLEAREENNNLNRANNCFIGNADRTMTASVAQIVAIGELLETGKLALLTEDLRETATARMKHPTLSLTELAELLGVGKSCVNHRLRKVMQIYREQGKTND